MACQAREVSCFCKYADLTCMCYKPVLVNLGKTTCHTEVPSNTPKASGLEDLSGKFVIITYDELPYVGQVLKVVGEDVQVSSMRQSDEKNVFMWPQIADIIFYNKKDVQAVISEPEPANSRYSQLSIQDWATFRTAWG
ncbi:unnamed protein product [Boreogadus saida]